MIYDALWCYMMCILLSYTYSNDSNIASAGLPHQRSWNTEVIRYQKCTVHPELLVSSVQTTFWQAWPAPTPTKTLWCLKNLLLTHCSGLPISGSPTHDVSLDFWAPCRMLLKRAENWMKLEVSTCFNLVHRCLRRSIHQILVDACNSLSIAGFGVRYVDVAWGSAGCFLCQPLPLFKARASSIKLVKPDTRTKRAQASDPQKSSNDIKCANHLPFMSGLLTGNGRGSLEGFCLSLCEPTLLEDFDREVARHGSAKQRKAT